MPAAEFGPTALAGRERHPYARPASSRAVGAFGMRRTGTIESDLLRIASALLLVPIVEDRVIAGGQLAGGDGGQRRRRLRAAAADRLDAARQEGAFRRQV